LYLVELPAMGKLLRCDCTQLAHELV